ncbi:SLBB domain-containing protein [Yoonia vestfoldensis]|uniref:SLBB domain-containing protein n=1 Tax=Yoonia vestfoldensis TaxID=245188 RepID=UPI000376F3AE|nr:SLBB domain-containing protein [Yoonia vestfoldensis]
MRRRLARIILRSLVGLLLSGCATLPSSGPSAAAIDAAAVETVSRPQDVLPFRIIDVSMSTLPTEATQAHRFPVAFREQGLRTADEVIDAGDQLDIRLWEVAEDGLFATAGRRETLLSLAVSNSGTISAPYAGTITARGLTTQGLRALLLDRYRGQAVEPEITVSLVQTQSRSTAVLGAVGTPGRVVIPPGGIRLLDLIAQAGGTPHAAWETTVTVRRGTTSATVALADILRHASNDIVVLPRDVVSVAHIPRRFAVYGGVRRPGNIEIPLETPHLAYLLAETGGLDDGVAQAKSVFVFRPAQGTASGDTVRALAFRFDFSVPDAFLLAGLFVLEPTDIVYVTSAQAADFQRFVALVLSPIVGTAAQVGN